MDSDEQALVTTTEALEATEAIARSAEFLYRYQLVLGTLAPTLGKQLLDCTEMLRENLWAAYRGAGTIYGDSYDGLERWLMEMTYLVNSQRKAAEIIVEHSMLQQLGGVAQSE